MTETTWAILGLVAACIGLIGLIAYERTQHRRELAESHAQAHAREASLLDRLMARDYVEYSSFTPERREATPQPDPDLEAQRMAQQAVDLAGTIAE